MACNLNNGALNIPTSRTGSIMVNASGRVRVPNGASAGINATVSGYVNTPNVHDPHGNEGARERQKLQLVSQGVIDALQNAYFDYSSFHAQKRSSQTYTTTAPGYYNQLTGKGPYFTHIVDQKLRANPDLVNMHATRSPSFLTFTAHQSLARDYNINICKLGKVHDGLVSKVNLLFQAILAETESKDGHPDPDVIARHLKRVGALVGNTVVRRVSPVQWAQNHIHESLPQHN